MNKAIKSADILVIADQQRLHSLFESIGELSGARIRRTFSIDEGLKSAAKAAPSLLFFQGRMGGLSAEIVTRHLRLEMKDLQTKIVMLCNPEDLPESGLKNLYATIDSSLPDGQLAEQVRSVIDSVGSGRKKYRTSENNKTEVKPVSLSGEHTEDIVEISSRESESENVNGGEISPSAEHEGFVPSFRDTLESAIEKAVKEISVSDRLQGESETSALHHDMTEPAGELKYQSVFAGAKGRKVRATIIAVSVLSLCALIFLFCYLNFVAEKTGPAAGKNGDKLETGGRSDSFDNNDTGSNPPQISKIPVEKQTPDGYIGYKVRRGETILYILTRRFGLSATKAANMLPRILEANGINDKTVLAVGQTVLVPSSLQLHHDDVKIGSGSKQPVETEGTTGRGTADLKNETGTAGEDAVPAPAKGTERKTAIEPDENTLMPPGENQAER